MSQIEKLLLTVTRQGVEKEEISWACIKLKHSRKDLKQKNIVTSFLTDRKEGINLAKFRGGTVPTGIEIGRYNTLTTEEHTWFLLWQFRWRLNTCFVALSVVRSVRAELFYWPFRHSFHGLLTLKCRHCFFKCQNVLISQTEEN